MDDRGTISWILRRWRRLALQNVINCTRSRRKIKQALILKKVKVNWVRKKS
jgi:hypothetical protein